MSSQEYDFLNHVGFPYEDPQKGKKDDLNSKRGGWSTAPFIIGSAAASTIAVYGVSIDLIPFFVHRFHMGDIKAVQMSNIIISLMNLTPVAGAILCDAYLGCYLTISIFTFISFVGSVMLTLTAWIPTLAPPSCDNALSSRQPPSITQFAFLCLAFTVTTLGAAGTSYTYVTMGANQLNKGKHQEVFVNWFFFVTTIAMLVAFTFVTYMMDNVGWKWGYGFCAALNLVALITFLLGKWRYQDVRPEGSPFLSLARVILGAIHKMNIKLSINEEDYYHGKEFQNDEPSILTSSFSFLNKAALITEGDTDLNGSIVKPWRLCTIQEVEDLKTLIKILPLWSTSIYLSTAAGIQSNLTILQSAAMDRSLGPHFKIPPACYQVFAFLSTTFILPVINRYFYPFFQTLIRRPATVLHRIGVGHVLNIAGLAAMAYVESRRLHVLHSHGLMGQADAVEPMSALWLVPPLLLIGVGGGFSYPGQVSLFYQEFPASLKNTSTAMMSLTIGIGFYLSAVVIDIIRRVSNWVADDDINNGRADYVFWLLAVLGGLNFFYYLVCAKWYKLQH